MLFCGVWHGVGFGIGSITRTSNITAEDDGLGFPLLFFFLSTHTVFFHSSARCAAGTGAIIDDVYGCSTLIVCSHVEAVGLGSHRFTFL
jgi:hypothetical protein